MSAYAPVSPPLPPGRFLVLISVRGLVDSRPIVVLEGLGKLKISTRYQSITDTDNLDDLDVHRGIIFVWNIFTCCCNALC